MERFLHKAYVVSILMGMSMLMMMGCSGKSSKKPVVVVDKTPRKEYDAAFSKEELAKVQAFLLEYYKNIKEAKVVSITIADNRDTIYDQVKEYELGNVIGAKVELQDSEKAQCRYILLVRENRDEVWKVLSEGC